MFWRWGDDGTGNCDPIEDSFYQGQLALTYEAMYGTQGEMHAERGW